MYLGGTGCTADTVTAGTSSKKDDDISRVGIFTDNRTSRSSTHNRTDLHTFCNVVRMIDFFYSTGCKTDLVSVGAVTVSCAADKFLLRKFTLQSFFYGYSRISRTGYTHCLIYIGTSGKRVTDGPAKAGSRTTKRLDLGRMVVGFVLEVDQPLFFFSVHIHRYHDTAGIDLIGLFLVCKFAFCFQFLHCHKSQIHQADKFVITAFVHVLMGIQIFFVCFFDWSLIVAFIKLHAGKLCGECGMTAVVRPVCIQNTDLCHRRITFLFFVKIILDVLEILECHGKVQRIVQFFQISLSHILESVKYLHILRIREYSYQCLRFLKSCLTRVYRVDAVMFDRLKLCVCHSSFNYISSCGADDRCRILIQELYTLYSGVCSLVKLSREEFYGKYTCALCHIKFLKIQIIYRRLCKYGLAGFLKYFIGDILHVITDQLTDCCHSADAKIMFDLMFQFLCFYCKGRFLFYIHTSYVAHRRLLSLYPIIRMVNVQKAFLSFFSAENIVS